MQVRVQDCDLGGSVEWRRPGQGFVQHARKGIDIGARIDLASLDLLGRGVLDRADEAARACGPVGGEVLHNAEVGEIRAIARGNEDVRRLHVAMDESTAVRRVECRANLSDDAQRAS